MRPIEHLLIVAGPSASGKSTLIRRLRADGLPELARQTGVEGRAWIRMRTQALAAPGAELQYVVLHYDFLWSYAGLNPDMSEGLEILTTILKGARRVSIATVWTPPARLVRQFIEAKLRVAPQRAPRKLTLKRAVFRLLPRWLIVAAAKLLDSKSMPGRFEDRPLVKQLKLVALYSRPEEVLRLYRRWFEFCDHRIADAVAHQIVEIDGKWKFHSRAEWENRVRPREDDLP
jgi:hypothetical protein